MEFADPVIGVSIEPATTEDAIRLSEGLEQLSTEDPTFRVRVDPDSLQTIISGMGELHLDVLIHRLAREFGVKSIVGTPEVAYRSGVQRVGVADKTMEKRGPGGRGQFARVAVRVEPLPRGSGVEFSCIAPQTEIPKEFVSVVEAGVREGIERGAKGGFALTDTRVTVTGGAAHPVDSTEVAFKVA
jgi:elongation factor G